MSETINLQLTGLHCGSCVGRAEKALLGIAGVHEATVNLANESASVRFDRSVETQKLTDALAEAGYPAMTEEVMLDISDMHCASCVGHVEHALQSVDGVTGATVNLASETAVVTYLKGTTTPEALADVSAKAGYDAKPRGRTDAEVNTKGAEADALRKSFLIAGVLTLPVFILEMGSHFVPGVHDLIARTIGMQASWVLQFVLVTAVLAWPGRVFFERGVPSLLRGAPDMNALVAIGTGAAWSFSTVATFVPSLLPEGTRAVYFEAAAVIVTLILLGRWLEARAKGRTGEAIRKLIGLKPKTALVEIDGEIREIPIAEISVGQIVHVRPGARVAMDGIVTDGASFVDESMITGEPVPVEKQVGAQVTGGTINGTGSFRFRVTKTGDETMLAQIIRMVSDAQGAKLPIQDLVNRITMYFVPAVLFIAAITVGTWLLVGPDPALGFALVAGVAVLIVACPCAMGLATPTSIMVGTGRAAEMGVLFRKGDALQALQDADLIAFDKTGTLTEGRPALTTLEVEGHQPDEVLRLVASVERLSEHPIAQAIVRAAEERGLILSEPSDFTSRTGFGVRADVDGHTILVGADRMMTAEGITLDAFTKTAEDIAQAGQTPLYAAIDGELAALIGVSDPIKPATRAAIGALHAMGKRIAMITGDNAATANAVAAQLGIDDVVAGVLPEGKVAAIRTLQREHGKIAFVGDGINDAPALASADIGIAIGTGTDVAIESADVVLMAGGIGSVVDAFEISRRTMRNIRENLFWAFAYNTALIPVAAGLLYIFGGPLLSPMLAAGAMALSSVFVLTNALRLRWVPRQAIAA